MNVKGKAVLLLTILFQCIPERIKSRRLQRMYISTLNDDAHKVFAKTDEANFVCVYFHARIKVSIEIRNKTHFVVPTGSPYSLSTFRRMCSTSSGVNMRIMWPSSTAASRSLISQCAFPRSRVGSCRPSRSFRWTRRFRGRRRLK